MQLNHTTGSFHGSGGVELFYQAWRPESNRGAVAIVHGVGEHSDRYGNVVERVARIGFAVYGYDLRGHGRSPGKRVHIDHWNQYREDLAAFLKLVSEKQPGVPIFLYGHSMGSMIALDYLVQQPGTLQGAILSGIPLEPAGLAKPHLVAIAHLLSRILPGFSVSLGLDHNALSRNPEVVAAYNADPLVSERVTVRWGTESLATLKRLKTPTTMVNIPVLVIHGEADSLNKASGARNLFESITSSDKTLRIYPGGYHEPHNDLNHEEVLTDITQWLERRVTS